ncbi:MAG: B12-binding domain-containing radical SAM protein [Nitrospinae bacterium]|nr:B12-binding domain-containing radical SAM protein [Nitrospinota bacterium]
MADVLFIQPDIAQNWAYRIMHREERYIPPLTYLHLSSVLEEKGYSVKIIDARIRRDTKEIIKRELDKRPILVGFSCMIGGQLLSLIDLSKLVKRYAPDIPVVWGGVHPSFFPLQTIREPYVDIIVKGEGEISILRLCEALVKDKDLKRINGIVYKDNGEVFNNPNSSYVDLDTLPFPAWHLIKEDIHRYLYGGFFTISTSRGCPHGCRFCYNLKFNKRYRALSSEKVLDQIEYIVSRYGIRRISFLDDNFVANPKRVKDICKGFKERGINIEFRCDMRIDAIEDSIIEEMAETGLKIIFTGVETGSSKILDKSNKGISLVQIKRAAKILKRFDICADYSFICGYPWETYGDIMATIEIAQYLHDLDPRSRCTLELLTPNYGTPLYEELQNDYGFEPKENLEYWAKVNWKNTYGKVWIKDPIFYEYLIIIFYLRFYPVGREGFPRLKRFIYPLKWWIDLRFKKRILKPAPEFRLLNYLVKMIIM